MRVPDVKAFNTASPYNPQQTPQPTPQIDPNWTNNPDQIAINLGKEGYQAPYKSNDKGSGERNWNNLLGNLSPDQLLKRYSSVSTGQLGTAQDRANYQAYSAFKSLIGRDPTSIELAQAMPAFQGGPTTGNAWLASYAQQQKTNPANLAAGSGKYADQINGVFQSQLGRAATPDEVTHFGSLLGTGNLDSYGLQNFLTGTPEYQKTQDTQFRSDLGNQLQNSDLQYFDKAKNGLMSQFAQKGQSFGNSSALDSALADLMGQIQQKRSDYMASLSSSQYGGNKQLALSNYGNTMDQYLNNTNQQRQQAQGQQNQLMDRANNRADYNQQMTDYMNFAGNNKSQGANPLYGLAGGLTGAAIGGFATGGNPAAIQAGYGIGNGVGNGYGFLNSRTA